MVGLGFACWPGPPRVGMLIYSAIVTLYLAYLGAAGGYGGVLRRQKNDAADAAAICEAAFDAVCRRPLAGEPGGVDASQDAGDNAHSCSTGCAAT